MIKIYGVGTDIVKISRLTKHLKNKKFLDRLFNKNEINKCKIRKNSTNCYAKRFAAKEAFSKAIGIGISKGIRFNEIVIKNTKSGKPQIELLGKTKIDKRVEANLQLVKQLNSLGVPKNQIFVTGHSCGGLTTLLFFSRYPDEAAGGIAYMQACFGKLTKQYKVKKLGVDKTLEKI